MFQKFCNKAQLIANPADLQARYGMPQLCHSPRWFGQRKPNHGRRMVTMEQARQHCCKIISMRLICNFMARRPKHDPQHFPPWRIAQVCRKFCRSPEAKFLSMELSDMEHFLSFLVSFLLTVSTVWRRLLRRSLSAGDGLNATVPPPEIPYCFPLSIGQCSSTSQERSDVLCNISVKQFWNKLAVPSISRIGVQFFKFNRLSHKCSLTPPQRRTQCTQRWPNPNGINWSCHTDSTQARTSLNI